MVLIRLITLEGLIHNVCFSAKWVSTKQNEKADALSRLVLVHFRRVGGNVMNEFPSEVPNVIWPISKIWID